MSINDAAYSRVGLSFIPESIKNEMMEKREDATRGWRVPAREQRESLSESELQAIGANLAPRAARSAPVEEDEYVESSKTLAMAALEAHGFLPERRSMRKRVIGGSERAKAKQDYRKHRSMILRKKATPQAKRMAKIARKKHARAFAGGPKKGRIQFTK